MKGEENTEYDKQIEPEKSTDESEEETKADGVQMKRKRRDLPARTVAILKKWMMSPEHIEHPYPSEEEKKELMKETGIDLKQLSNWFTNARKRVWKPFMILQHQQRIMNSMRETENARRNLNFASSSTYVPYTTSNPYSMQPRVRANSESCVAFHGYSERSRAESACSNQDLDALIHASRIANRVAQALARKRTATTDATAYEKKAKGEEMFEPKRKMWLSRRVVDTLKEWMMSPEHIQYPYPTEAEKKRLCDKTGIDIYQLNNWFTNNRKRLWRPAMESIANENTPNNAPTEQAPISPPMLPSPSRESTISLDSERTQERETAQRKVWKFNAIRQPPMARSMRSQTVDIGQISTEMNMQDILSARKPTIQAAALTSTPLIQARETRSQSYAPYGQLPSLSSLPVAQRAIWQ